MHGTSPRSPAYPNTRTVRRVLTAVVEAQTKDQRGGWLRMFSGFRPPSNGIPAEVDFLQFLRRRHDVGNWTDGLLRQLAPYQHQLRAPSFCAGDNEITTQREIDVSCFESGVFVSRVASTHHPFARAHGSGVARTRVYVVRKSFVWLG